MTREKLFLRNKYPVRKRAEFELPRKGLKMKVELYFEKTDSRMAGQWVGEYTAAVSEDGTIRLAVAKIISPKGLMAHYLERRIKFKRISPENLMLVVSAFEKEFQEKYEIIINDPETDALMSEMLGKAHWEKF